MAYKVKESVLVADLTRVMRNISPLCADDERKGKIQHYMARMQYSGYGIEERVKIYRAAKRRYDEMVRKDEEGIQPLYRSKEWNRTERMKEKERKKRTWFKGDGSEAVFFVDATPESELAEKCRKEFRKSGLKVKVVERSGRSVKRTLVKSNPFKKPGCNRQRRKPLRRCNLRRRDLPQLGGTIRRSHERDPQQERTSTARILPIQAYMGKPQRRNTTIEHRNPEEIPWRSSPQTSNGSRQHPKEQTALEWQRRMDQRTTQTKV